jgi:hypothetical protein
VVPLAASAAANADAEAAGNLQHQRAVVSGLSATAAAGGAASASAAADRQPQAPFGTGAGDLLPPSALPPADPCAALYADALRRMACVCAAAAVDGPAAGVPAVLHDQTGPVAALERVSGGAADTSPRHRLWLALAAIAREADLGAAFAGGHAGGQPFLGAFRDQARSSAVGTAQEISHAVAGGGSRLLPLDRAATMGPSLRLQWAAGSLAHLQAVRLAELEARVAASSAAGGGGAPLPAPQGAGDSALLAAVRRAVWADALEFQRNHPASAAAAGGLGMRGLLAGGGGADGAADAALYPAWFEAGQATGLATPYGSVSLPLFPQLYHLLSCGGYSEALSVLAQVQSRLPAASPFHELAAALHQAVLAFAHVVHAIGTADPRTGILDAARAAAAQQAGHPATRRALQGVIGRWYAQSCGARERQSDGGRFRGGEEEGGPEELLLSDGYCQAVLRLLCFGVEPEAPRHLDLSAGPDYWFLRLWYAAAAPLSVAIGGRDAFAFDIFTAGEVFTEGVEEAGGEGGAAAGGSSSGGERRDAEDVLDPDGSQAYACAEHLLLCGFPERAVAHLVGRGQAAGPQCLHDAVHLGLALHYLGLLHTLPSAEAIQRHNDLFSAAIKPGPRGADDRVVVAVATEPDPESDTRYANSLFYVTLTYKRPRPGHSTADLASWEPLAEEEEPELTLHALDLASLVASYVDYSLPGRPEPAADYVSVACYDDAEQQGLQLAALLSQSRAFDTLAGPLAVVGGAFASSIAGSYLATHGLVSPAGLPQQLRPDRHLQFVVMEAAHMCEVQGRLQDALALYLRLPYPGLGLDAALPILLRELSQLADLPWRDPAAAGALLGSTASFKALADRSLLKVSERRSSPGAGTRGGGVSGR